MGRILALDYGSKTIGVAFSDPLKTIAMPFETIRRNKEGQLRASQRRIVDLCRDNDIELIVLGYPLNMDDTKGERALRTEEFKTKLEYRLFRAGISCPVVLWDERLSTVGAREILNESLIRARSEQKKSIDSIAAALILEDYLKNSERFRAPNL